MSNLVDAILGIFNSGNSSGNAPSGGSPDDQVAPSAMDPYGNRVGSLAPAVPLPRSRPPEAGPPAYSPPAYSAGMSPPEMQPGDSGGTNPGFGSGGLAAALG